MNDSYIHNILCLKHGLKKIFMECYPYELILLIVRIMYRRIKISFGSYHASAVINGKIYMLGNNLNLNSLFSQKMSSVHIGTVKCSMIRTAKCSMHRTIGL